MQLGEDTKLGLPLRTVVVAVCALITLGSAMGVSLLRLSAGEKRLDAAELHAKETDARLAQASKEAVEVNHATSLRLQRLDDNYSLILLSLGRIEGRAVAPAIPPPAPAVQRRR